MSATSFSTYVYKIPTEVGGKPTEMTGEIHLRKPTIIEKYAYLDQCGFEVGEDGMLKSLENKLKASIKMVEVTLPHIQKVEIQKVSGENIASAEEMSMDSDCEAILFELSGLLMNGFKPSKK